MKNIKKLLSIVMVLTLVLALGAQAFALDITVDEKNDDGVGNYSAYKLFDLTTTAEARPDGSGFSYTVNSKYASILYAAASLTGENATNEKLLDYIEGLDADGVRTFADAVYTAIKAAEMEADYTSVDGKFTGVAQGYYLIAEDGAVGGVTSQVMLDTAGRESIKVTTKEEKPESHKKVQEKNDTTGATAWQDAADYDIGDHVPFQLTGTLPGDYDAYDSYKIVFHDTESTGLTFDGASTVKVTCGGVTIESADFAANGIVVTSPASDGHSFDIEITDVTKTFPAAANGSEIVVTYTSTLNNGCVVGIPGNDNEMYMEYTNDHYSNGTGTTPKDVVTVFTFKLDVNKVQPDIDDDGENEPLAGAAFTLYKLVPASSVTEGEDEYETIEGDEDNVLLQIEVKTAGDAVTFDFSGLDSGTYLLSETTTPPGFNSIDDIKFTVTASYDDLADDPQLKDLVVTTDSGITFTVTRDDLGSATGGITTDILNQTGLELPETGGIGTTIFYVVGGVLVAGAVILLVTKKRVNGAK